MHQTIIPFQTLSSHNVWTQYIERMNTVLRSVVDRLVVAAKYKFCFKSSGYNTLLHSLVGGFVYDSAKAFDKGYIIYKAIIVFCVIYIAISHIFGWTTARPLLNFNNTITAQSPICKAS